MGNLNIVFNEATNMRIIFCKKRKLLESLNFRALVENYGVRIFYGLNFRTQNMI